MAGDESERGWFWPQVKTLLAWFGALCLLTIIAVGYYTFSTAFVPPRVLQTCTQPDTVVYEKGRTFKVFRRSTGWPFADDHIDVNVGVEESYGVGVELTSPGKDNPIDCRWSDDGVTIVERSGVSHFVPKTVFIGGR